MPYDGIQVEDFIHMIAALSGVVCNRPGDIGGLAIFPDIMHAENSDARRHTDHIRIFRLALHISNILAKNAVRPFTAEQFKPKVAGLRDWRAG